MAIPNPPYDTDVVVGMIDHVTAVLAQLKASLAAGASPTTADRELAVGASATADDLERYITRRAD